MRLSVFQVSGEMLCLEVPPEMTGKELKRKIKEAQHWDEATRRTTIATLVVGDRLLRNHEKVVDALADLVVNVVFRTNTVRCSSRGAFSSEINPEHLLAVEIPSHDTSIAERAFQGSKMIAKLTIPDSVSHIGESAFQDCSSLASLTIPSSVTHIGGECISGLQLSGELDHPRLSDPHWEFCL